MSLGVKTFKQLACCFACCVLLAPLATDAVITYDSPCDVPIVPPCSMDCPCAPAVAPCHIGSPCHDYQCSVINYTVQGDLYLNTLVSPCVHILPTGGVNGDIAGMGGVDCMIIEGDVTGEIRGNSGDDVIYVTASVTTDIVGGGGSDIIMLMGAAAHANLINGDSQADKIEVCDADIDQTVSGGDGGSDCISVQQTVTQGLEVRGGPGSADKCNSANGPPRAADCEEYMCAPTAAPTPTPTRAPTTSPTGYPSASPTAAPSPYPSAAPSATPTRSPSTTAFPTLSPLQQPSAAPWRAPTHAPTPPPSAAPTTPAPSAAPTAAPHAAAASAQGGSGAGGGDGSGGSALFLYVTFGLVGVVLLLVCAVLCLFRRQKKMAARLITSSKRHSDGFGESARDSGAFTRRSEKFAAAGERRGRSHSNAGGSARSGRQSRRRSVALKGPPGREYNVAPSIVFDNDARYRSQYDDLSKRNNKDVHGIYGYMDLVNDEDDNSSYGELFDRGGPAPAGVGGGGGGGGDSEHAYSPIIMQQRVNRRRSRGRSGGGSSSGGSGGGGAASVTVGRKNVLGGGGAVSGVYTTIEMRRAAEGFQQQFGPPLHATYINAPAAAAAAASAPRDGYVGIPPNATADDALQYGQSLYVAMPTRQQAAGGEGGGEEGGGAAAAGGQSYGILPEE